MKGVFAGGLENGEMEKSGGVQRVVCYIRFYSIAIETLRLEA